MNTIQKLILLIGFIILVNSKIVVRVNQYHQQKGYNIMSAGGKRLLLQSKNPQTVAKIRYDDYTEYIKLALGDGSRHYSFEVNTQSERSYIPYQGCESPAWPSYQPAVVKNAQQEQARLKQLDEQYQNDNGVQLYNCQAPCSGTKDDDKISKVYSYNCNGFRGCLTVEAGFRAVDTIKINNKYSANQTSLDLVTKFTNRLANKAQGSIGFGYSPLNQNLIGRLKQNKVIQQAIFSYFRNDGQSFVTIGDYERYFAAEPFTVYNQKYTGNDDYYSNTYRKWQLQLDTASVKVGSQLRPEIVPTSRVAYIDLTVDDLQLPAQQFKALQDEIVAQLKTVNCKKEASNEYINCTNLKDINLLPTISVAFSNQVVPSGQVQVQLKVFQIPPQVYARLDESGQNTIILIRETKSYIEQEEHEKSKVQNQNVATPLNAWVLGRRFLQHFYVVFDNDLGQIRIAKANQIKVGEHLMSDASRYCIIFIGIFLIALAIVLLLFILRPIQFVPSNRNKQQQVVELQKQQQPEIRYVYQQQQPVVVRQYVEQPVVVRQVVDQSTLARSQQQYPILYRSQSPVLVRNISPQRDVYQQVNVANLDQQKVFRPQVQVQYQFPQDNLVRTNNFASGNQVRQVENNVVQANQSANLI